MSTCNVHTLNHSRKKQISFISFTVCFTVLQNIHETRANTQNTHKVDTEKTATVAQMKEEKSGRKK